MNNRQFVQYLREQLAKNETAAVLLQNSPQLDEVLLQSARHHAILRQIRLGLVDGKNAELTQNQVNKGLLDLLRDIETQIDNEKATPTSEYDGFIQDIFRYKHNQESSSSTPLSGKTVNFLDKKSLKKLFFQSRVKRYFTVHQIRANTETSLKLKALHLMA
jgi:hypothetical protein